LGANTLALMFFLAGLGLCCDTYVLEYEGKRLDAAFLVMNLAGC
jgi:hypothetical protein